MSRLPALSQFNFGCFDGWESRAAGAGQRREDVNEIIKVRRKENTKSQKFFYVSLSREVGEWVVVCNVCRL
ncbi:MAG: hypothetical protein F6K24_48240 [Okeania sp. SIO2D1]|uniref:hypothetical protein n=1 Tax=Okeania sp. SIO2C9 TaxID=2607791 RepID=UPI0013B94C5A|nr:hypothetical protein [Okeania sp. SIO2C9]NEQ78163.1 hypothetical protein [Okeania sp. SIO2C9]NES72443.1 hypothetical protein [Okeania sp. SIO2D1]